MKVTEDDVKEFLDRVKSIIDSGSPFFHFLGNRDKNRQLITELGLTIPLVKDCIANLSTRDFFDAIKNEANSKIYVFGLRIEPYDCYIKLELIEKHGTCYCKCHSFHEAEKPLNFPFKGGEE